MRHYALLAAHNVHILVMGEIFKLGEERRGGGGGEGGTNVAPAPLIETLGL